MHRCSAIDNLNKGASTQCLRRFPLYSPLDVKQPLTNSAENMNLALGYAEFQGIPKD